MSSPLLDCLIPGLTTASEMITLNMYYLNAKVPIRVSLDSLTDDLYDQFTPGGVGKIINQHTLLPRGKTLRSLGLTDGYALHMDYPAPGLTTASEMITLNMYYLNVKVPIRVSPDSLTDDLYDQFTYRGARKIINQQTLLPRGQTIRSLGLTDGSPLHLPHFR